jgi:CRP-like cAMP-binding protein
VHQHAPGQLICAQGAASDEVLLVVEGSAKILVETTRGTASIGLVEPGQTIGELGAITGEPRSSAAVADDDGAAVLSIPAAVFRALLDQDLRATSGMLRLVSERLTRSIGKVVATGGATAIRTEVDSKPN